MSQTWRRSAGVGAIALALAIGGGSVAQASAPSWEQQGAFAALRGTPEKSVSEPVKRLVDSKDGRSNAVDASNVYRVQAPTGGSWALLPGKNGICVVFEDREGVSTCANTADAKAGALQVLLIKPLGDDPVGGTAEQVGVLPDAVASARAMLTSGASVPVEVGDRGQYVVRPKGSARPTGLSLRGGSGQLLSKQRRAWQGGAKAKPTARAASSVAVFCLNSSWVCTFYGSEWRGPYALINVAVSSWDGNWICGNATNSDGSWAGSSVCTTGTTTVNHPYNGSSRTAWAGPGVAGVPVYGFGSWNFN